LLSIDGFDKPSSRTDRTINLFANPQSGTHTLIVSDHLFRGGPEYRYVVQATAFGSSAVQTQFIDEWRLQVASLIAMDGNVQTLEHQKLDRDVERQNASKREQPILQFLRPQ